MVAHATPDRDALFRQWSPYMQKLGRQWLQWVNPFGRCDISAADVAQEIALCAARKFPSYDPKRGEFSTWLSVVARSAAGTMRVKARAAMRSRLTITASDSLHFQQLQAREAAEAEESEECCP